jgi:hypothetical protein
VLLYLSGALVLAVGLGLNPTFSPELQTFALTVLTYLLSAFVITIAVDLFFILIIFILEIVLSRILGQQLQYNR